MKKYFTYWLRWIAVLPGALIAGILSTFPLHWLLYFTFAKGETISGVNIRPIEYAIYPFVTAIVFILVGAEIAPMYKFRTAIALAILYIMSVIGVFFLGPKYGVYGIFEARSIGPVIGLLLGLYIVRRKEKNLPPISEEPSNRVNGDNKMKGKIE